MKLFLMLFSKKRKFECLCCGCFTLDERGGYDICPVCYWEDDAYLLCTNDKIEGVLISRGVSDNQLLDIPLGANHGLTPRQGFPLFRDNSACIKTDQREVFIQAEKYVRPPKKSEMSHKRDLY